MITQTGYPARDIGGLSYFAGHVEHQPNKPDAPREQRHRVIEVVAPGGVSQRVQLTVQPVRDDRDVVAAAGLAAEEALGAELMVHFSIDARRIRAEGD